MKISVITPSYNQDIFIERTILSVIRQKGDFDLEYIIIDGKSTDKSIDIIKRYHKAIQQRKIDIYCKNISFRRISENDSGQSHAINKGLKMATGDIVTYLNSDDTYEDGCLQEVVNALGDNIHYRCYGKCKIIDIHDREIRKGITWYKNFIGKTYSYKKLLTENFISQMTVFWKRNILDDIGFFDEDEHLCMDYDYRLRIGERHDPIYIPTYIANFRLYNTSKSGSRFVKQFSDELRIAKKYANGRYQLHLLLHRLNVYKTVRIYKILEIFGI